MMEQTTRFEIRCDKLFCITPDDEYECLSSKPNDDLSSRKFNRLLVICRIVPPTHLKDRHSSYWLCLCDCGKFTVVRRNGLTAGKTKSCGCYHKELNSKKRKDNIYDLSGPFGIGYTGNTNKQFYFDLEDYDLIKQYYWVENSNGYARAYLNKREVLMHRLVCHVTDKDIHVDHRYHNNLDNRKNNLRVTTCHNNTMNEKLAINNTSGVTGVSYEDGRWRVYIWHNGKAIHLGSYYDKKDAIKARIDGENKYFKEFGYHNSMEGYINNEQESSI